MGTPWGCPTTGVTPSERKQSAAKDAVELRGRWCRGCVVRVSTPPGKGNKKWQEVEGTPLSFILWATRNPNSAHSREKCLALSWECFLLLSLAPGPLLPPPKGDMGTDGTRHCTTLPSML